MGLLFKKIVLHQFQARGPARANLVVDIVYEMPVKKIYTAMWTILRKYF